MYLDLKKEHCYLNCINNHAITRIVRSQSADENSDVHLIVFSECAIEKSNVPLRTMTAMVFHEDSTFHASPALISTSSNFKVADDDRSAIEVAVAESTVALLIELKMNAQLDPNKFEVVGNDEFADMLSECC